MPTMRLDMYVHQNGLAESRHRAQEMIRRGFVRINGVICTKPSRAVIGSDTIDAADSLRYVSRAGEKLAFALEHFDVDISGVEALDIGSSTGGFTDCLLQHGAAKVVAIDVGTDQLHHTLRNNPRIELHEQTDIRNYISNQRFTLIVCDVSFISLTHIIPEISRLLAPNGKAILLVKPQFEVSSRERTKSGIVKSSVKLEPLFEAIQKSVTDHGLVVASDYAAVPLKGGDGNQEYVVMIQN